MVIDPTNAPNNNLFKLVCLLSIIATEMSNNKSKPKFSSKTRSI